MESIKFNLRQALISYMERTNDSFSAISKRTSSVMSDSSYHISPTTLSNLAKDPTFSVKTSKKAVGIAHAIGASDAEIAAMIQENWPDEADTVYAEITHSNKAQLRFFSHIWTQYPTLAWNLEAGITKEELRLRMGEDTLKILDSLVEQQESIQAQVIQKKNNRYHFIDVHGLRYKGDKHHTAFTFAAEQCHAQITLLKERITTQRQASDAFLCHNADSIGNRNAKVIRKLLVSAGVFTHRVATCNDLSEVKEEIQNLKAIVNTLEDIWTSEREETKVKINAVVTFDCERRIA